MKIKCKINKIRDLDSSIKESIKKYLYMDEEAELLELNKEFIVQGMIFRDNMPWYYIYEDTDVFPIPVSSEFFEIIDETFSKYWYLQQDKLETFIVFKEWAEDINLYEKLLDDDPLAIELFRKYKSLLEHENDCS